MHHLATWWTSTSKTFEESSVIRIAEAFWKRSAASVTGYAHKYRFDPFFRTEIRTVALLVLFSLFILGVVGISSSLLYRDVTTAMSEAINESIEAGSPPSSIGALVVEKLNDLQRRNITTSSAIVTLVSGYVLGRVVLSPTRSALESQKQFIGNVAHELRTPLSNIKTSTEVALMNADLTEEMKSVFTGTVEELDRISEILNNLLSLSVSVRPERIEFHDVDLGTGVEEIG